MKEREISLLDLMVEILLRWRVFIVWALIGGSLMGCFSYVNSSKAAQSQKGQSELEYLQSGLSDVEMNHVNTVLNYEDLWEAEDVYYQQSIKMQIDPLNEPRALLTFQVVAEDLETAKSIAWVYEGMVPDGLGKWLSEKTSNEASEAALSELITLEQNMETVTTEMMTAETATSDTITSTVSVFYNMPEEKDNVFRVAICHISEEQCLELAEKVEEYFGEQQSQLSRKMGEHQIQLVDWNFSYVVDRTLMENQQQVQSKMITWSTNATKLKDNFTASERQLYNYLVVNRQGDDSVMPIIQPTVSVKYVFVGMILFVFMYAFYIFLKYILNTRVRATDDLAAIYEVPQLGMIPVAEGRKKIFAFVDDWILKLRNWNKRKFTPEEATGLAAVAVKMAAQKDSLDEIGCIGCNLRTNEDSMADAIQKILRDSNISMKVLNNVLYDQEAMEQMSSVKGAFLLERVGETLYDEINREIELLRRQEIKVLGIIVAE